MNDRDGNLPRRPESVPFPDTLEDWADPLSLLDVDPARACRVIDQMLLDVRRFGLWLARLNAMRRAAAQGGPPASLPAVPARVPKAVVRAGGFAEAARRGLVSSGEIVVLLHDAGSLLEVQRRLLRRANKPAAADAAQKRPVAESRIVGAYHLSRLAAALLLAAAAIVAGGAGGVVAVSMIPPPPPPQQRAIRAEIPVQVVADRFALQSMRHQQEVLASALGANFSGRDNYVAACLAVYRQQSRLASRLPSLLAQPPGKTLEFNDALLYYFGSRLIAGADRADLAVLPVNGHRLAVAARDDDSKRQAEYYFAEDAVSRLSGMLPAADDTGLDDRAQLAVLAHAERPDRPLPEEVLRRLSTLPGRPPVFLVVTARVDDASFREGHLRFVSVDPQHKVGPDSVEMPFRWTAAPLPVFDSFPLPSAELSEIAVSRTSPDELLVRVKGAGGDARVSFSSREGLPISQKFPERFVELCFEACLVAGGERIPDVQFGSGGDQMFTTSAPPVKLGRSWQRFSVPVDLGGAEKWTKGMFVRVLALAPGEEVTLHLRNAYVRSVESGGSGHRVL